MNKQEILRTLNMPSAPDFPALHAICQDPKLLEDVLSLAIARGETRGRTDVICNYNRLFHGEPVPGEPIVLDPPEGNFSGSSDPTSGVADVGLDNVVGYVLL